MINLREKSYVKVTPLSHRLFLLSCQLFQHIRIKIFVDGNVFCEPLPPSSLDHEISGEELGGRGFKWMQNDISI